MDLIKSNTIKLKTKRTFLKKGTCSRTFFYILNREFGHPKEQEEIAIDPMAGGILQQGYQCWMLWGAYMVLGADSLRRSENLNHAIGLAIKSTQYVMDSFKKRAKSIECADITNTDFSNKWSFAKYMLSGKFYGCFKLAGRWAPEAIKAAHEGLSQKVEYKTPPLSCASEVVKKMGGTKEEMAMVAGFAGGMGLSGDACGALVASIWKTKLDAVREGNIKTTISDPVSQQVVDAFYKETDYEIECSAICGKRFTNIDEHTEFIKSGGCSKLIQVLSAIDNAVQV